MQFIEIDTDNCKAVKTFCVVAKSTDGAGTDDGRLGNVTPAPQSQIKWKAHGQGWLVRFEIHFSKPDTKELIWPFTTLANGDPVPSGYTGPLEIPRNDEKTLTLSSDAPPDIKYAVKAVTSPSKEVDDLDPMIIVRPMAQPPSQEGSVLLAVTSAVVGAAVAAAATAYMLSN